MNEGGNALGTRRRDQLPMNPSNGFFFFHRSTLSLFIFFNWRIIALQATWVQSPSWEGPLEERNWHPTPVFLPGKLMGRRAKQSKMHYS